MRAAVLALWGVAAAAQQPTVDEIMSRVGRHQALAQDARKSFVYQQHIRMRFLRSNGKLAREELRDYTVSPQPRGTKKELIHFEGRYADHGKLIPYAKPGYEYKGLDIDGDLIDDLCNSFTNDENSRDGIANDLFPLTAHQQYKYDFTLKGREQYRGRAVYRVHFEAKPHLEHGSAWAGDALIDTAEFQPVAIDTRLAWHMPLVVRTVLGTNIRQLGFSLTYAKFDEGLWFPVSYGGEFHVKAVFLYKRTITIALKNENFRRAEVSSTVAYHEGGQ